MYGINHNRKIAGKLLTGLGELLQCN